MKTLLVPIDFQAGAIHALQYIDKAFPDQSISLELVYVSPSFKKKSEVSVKKEFEVFQKENLEKYRLPYSFTVLEGELIPSLQHFIDNKKPSLLVIGLMGSSLVKKLATLTRCPMLMIPENAELHAVRNIMYANDFHSIKESPALEPLREMAQSLHAKVHVVHIAEDRALAADEAEAPLEYYLNPIEHEYVSIISPDFVKAINTYAVNKKIDLLTLLLRDHGTNSLHTKGVLVNKLITESKIPILSLV